MLASDLLVPTTLSSSACLGQDVEKELVVPGVVPESLTSAPIDIADLEVERKLLWKLDCHVVPPLFVLFLLAFLDRVNIGNANIQGLSTELHLEKRQYNIALFIFFIPYIIFEVTNNIILRRLDPSTFLSVIMFLCGITTIGQGLVRSFQGLVAMRFLLGFFEAGLLPGCVYLISMYYKRYEFQRRLSVFYVSGILAGAFGGLFAFALGHMDGVGGYSGWRWIFILEGLLTVIVSIFAKFFIVGWPENASFLSPSELLLLKTRLANETPVHLQMSRLDRLALTRVFSDWKIYVGMLMYFGVVNTGYTTSFFIPTIVLELEPGTTSAEAQVKSIPIFMVAAAVSLMVAWATDKVKHRYGFCMAGVAVASTGYVILLCQESVSGGVRYMACFFVTVGCYMTQGVTIAWLSNNVSGHYKRAIASGFQVGIGNLGGIIASNIFLVSQAPRYPLGYGVSLAMLLLCGSACTVFFFGLRKENSIRDEGGRDYTYDEKDVDNMGDGHPEFRFGY